MTREEWINKRGRDLCRVACSDLEMISDDASDALHYRSHLGTCRPQTLRMLELIRDGDADRTLGRLLREAVLTERHANCLEQATKEYDATTH